MSDKKSNANKNEAALENSHELKMMRDAYEKGGLNRREFMQGVVAAGLSAAAASTFVNASFDIRAQTPQRGGKVTWATNVHGPNDATDPALFTGGPDDSRARAHFNNLLQFNDDMTVRPELAAEYESNSDNTQYTLRLRDDVKWHDGSQMTADDVVYSMRRHIGDDAVSVSAGLVADITSWEKVDTYTVRANLSTPNPDLPQILATAQMKIIKNDAENLPGYWQKPIGTGPFIMTEFTPGVTSIHKRNDDYWREPAWLDELEMFGITDDNARVNALLAGDINMLATVVPSAFEVIENSDNAKLHRVEAGPFINLALMQDRHPGENKDFVLAVKNLQDRKRFVRTYLRGNGAAGNDQPISKQYPEFCADVPERTFDLDKAAFHWKKSGLSSDNLPALHFAQTDPGVIEYCTQLGAESAKIGMNLPLKQVPSDGYWDAYPKNYAMICSGWDMRPTANMLLSEVFAGPSPNNETIWQNDRFNELLIAARSEQDRGVWKEMHCEMQNLIWDDCATPIPGFRNIVDGLAKNVHGVPQNPLGAHGNHSWPEFVWLSDE